MVRAFLKNKQKTTNLDNINYRKPLYYKDFPFIIFWSQKSACTVLVKWFFFHIGKIEDALKYSKWIHKYENQVFKNTEKYLEDVEKAIREGNKPAFKFVRDPYKRAVSSFLMLFGGHVKKNPGNFANTMWSKLGTFHEIENILPSGISFKMYLEYLKYSLDRQEYVNGHFARQYTNDEEKIIQKYYKIEQLKDHLDALTIEYGLIEAPDTVFDSTHHKNYTKCNENVSDTIFNLNSGLLKQTPSYEYFYSPTTIKLVEDIFADDFKHYGYPKDMLEKNF